MSNTHPINYHRFARIVEENALRLRSEVKGNRLRIEPADPAPDLQEWRPGSFELSPEDFAV
jgi:hypothetical protein